MGNKTYYTQLRLDPLGKESARRCSRRCLATDRSVRAQASDYRKDRGQPFFMEETVQVLFDEGVLMRDGVP